MDNQTATDKILELVVCDCKKRKYPEQFQCVLLQVSCIDICKCKGECHNEIPESFVVSDEELE